MGGRFIMPGLTDAHLHLKHYSLSLQKIDCETDTKEECLRRVEERVRKAKPGEWILGHGWNQNVWGDWPVASELDATPVRGGATRQESGRLGLESLASTPTARRVAVSDRSNARSPLIAGLFAFVPKCANAHAS